MTPRRYIDPDIDSKPLSDSINIRDQAESLERPDTERAWRDLKQSLGNNTLVLRVTRRSMEGILVELFARNERGARIYLSGMGTMPKSIEKWYGSPVYQSDGIRIQTLNSCELPLRAMDVESVLETLRRKGLIPRTHFGYDLQYAWEISNDIDFNGFSTNYSAYIKTLEKIGYEIFPAAFRFIQQENRHAEAMKNAKTIGDVKDACIKLRISWYEQLGEFCRQHLRPPEKKVNLDKFYILPGLECAATAKTIFNCTGHEHFTCHLLPIGPLEAMSAIASNGFQELAQQTRQFTQLPQALINRLRESGLEDKEKQQIVLLKWRLELQAQATCNHFFRNCFPNSIPSQLSQLIQAFFPIEILAAMSEMELNSKIHELTERQTTCGSCFFIAPNLIHEMLGKEGDAPSDTTELLG